MGRIFDTSDRKAPTDVFTTDELGSTVQNRGKFRCTRLLAVICALAALIFLISTVILATFLALKYKEDKEVGKSIQLNYFAPAKKHIQWPQPSGSLDGHYKRAAIATDHGLCSEIGRDILLHGGNAVEATIAGLICIGVVNPQSSGLGGGFLMTVYNSTTGKCIAINARETAPALSDRLMFIKNPKEAIEGYKAIATPSELHGLWTAFKKYGSGKVEWRTLIEPSIDLALNGFPISSNLAETLAEKEPEILAEESMRSVFVNPATGRVYKEGDLIKRESLGITLQLIANSTNPVRLFYKGAVAERIANEMQTHGGILSIGDLSSYETIIEESPLQIPILSEDLIMCGPPPPSSFVVTQLIIAVLAEFYGNQGYVDLDDPLVYQRLIEAEKFGYVHRSMLGDLAFVKDARSLVKNMTNSAYKKWISSMIKNEAQPLAYYTANAQSQVWDHGTSHISTIDSYGNAVSATDTVNLRLGAMRVSPEFGIVWNNEMDDFSTPGVPNAFNIAPSETNYIEPGKRPMSSMSPTVIYDKSTGKVKMSVGASGGSFIISATAQTVIRALIFNQTVKEAVDAPRLHNQFLPHTTQYESSFPKPIIDELIFKRGQSMTSVKTQKSVVQVLEVKEDGFIHGNSDFRRKTATYVTGF